MKPPQMTIRLSSVNLERTSAVTFSEAANGAKVGTTESDL